MLVESVLIKPLTFYWRNGMTLDSAPARQWAQYRYYLEAAMEPQKWLKLFSGRSALGLTGATKLVVDRLRCAASGASRRGTTDEHSQTSVEQLQRLTHPDGEDLPRDLKRATSDGRHVTMVFAKGDPGYSLLMNQARTTAMQLMATRSLSVTSIDHADHTFSRHPTQLRLVKHLLHSCRFTDLPVESQQATDVSVNQ